MLSPRTLCARGSAGFGPLCLGMMRSLALLVATSFAPLCGSEQPSPSDGAQSSRSSAASPVAQPETPPGDAVHDEAAGDDPPEQVKARMQDHFASVTKIADAVIDGDVEAAQEAAAWFVENVTDEGLPPGWSEHVERMRMVAQRIGEATELEAAAHATGSMLGHCGACHRAVGANPTFADTLDPPQGETAAAEMQRHQWALARLSEGLVGPSEAAWDAGAQQLRAPPSCATEAAMEVGDPAAVRDVARRFERLAGKASTARDLDARGRLYGEMLQTCAACHRSGC